MESFDQPDLDGFRRFAGLVGRQVDLDLSAAGPDSLLRDDLGFDSLAMAEVAVLLADRGIVLPDDLLGELRTLGDLHHYATVLVPARSLVAGSVGQQVLSVTAGSFR